MYPAVEDVWTNFVCGRSVVVFQIFKAYISRKAKKRYGHSLWMNVPGSFHEAGVIALLPSISTRTSMRESRAAANGFEIPPQLQLPTATSDKSVSGSILAYVMRNEISRACALIPFQIVRHVACRYPHRRARRIA